LLIVASTLGAAAATAAPGQPIHGADPSATAGQVAFQKGRDARAVLRRGQKTIHLPGREPAIGGRLAVVRVGDGLEILRRNDRRPLSHLDLQSVWASAISGRWVVFAQSGNHHDVLRARRLNHGRPKGPSHVVVRVGHPTRLGHPGLDGRTLVYAVSRPRSSIIAWRQLGTGRGGVIARARRGLVCCPAVSRGQVVYVHASRRRESSQATFAPPLVQRVMLGGVGSRRAHPIYTRRSPHGTLFSTALSARRAYVTVLHRRSARILTIRR
jgi:hypothetical protein